MMRSPRPVAVGRVSNLDAITGGAVVTGDDVARAGARCSREAADGDTGQLLTVYEKDADPFAERRVARRIGADVVALNAGSRLVRADLHADGARKLSVVSSKNIAVCGHRAANQIVGAGVDADSNFSLQGCGPSGIGADEVPSDHVVVGAQPDGGDREDAADDEAVDDKAAHRDVATDEIEAFAVCAGYVDAISSISSTALSPTASVFALAPGCV